MNPLEKIVSLLTKLQGELVQDGEAEEAAYKRYVTYCQDASFTKENEIKSAKSEKDLLEATISKSASDITTSTGKIEDLSGAISQNEAKLKKAKGIRAKEEDTFQASEKELMGAIDMLGRAIDILEKEMAKTGSAALLQTSETTQQLENVVMGLGAVIEGAGLGATEDLQKLTALLQDRQQEEDAGQEGSSQSPKAYEGKSGGIIEVLEDLRDKAETQLREIRTGETKAIQNYDLIKQALTDETNQFKKELAEEKASLSEAKKDKATAEGNLAITTKELAKGTEDYASLQRDCMRKGGDHEATTAGRSQEMSVLIKSKKIVQAQMSGAAALQTDTSFSFAQLGMSSQRPNHQTVVGQNVVALVQRLATQQNSNSLRQLASRISAVMRYSSSSADPFAKVKNLISDLLKKLIKQQQSDSTEKEYCDREMKKTEAKQGELTDDSEGLKSKIDQAASASSKLKSQVKDLQYDLATLAKLTREMSDARNDAHKAYLADKADQQKGLEAVRSAIHVLRDYYGAAKEDESLIQTDAEDTDSESDSDEMMDDMEQPKPPEKFKKSSGAGAGIIGLLEVVESDMAKNMAELQTEEDDAQSAYKREIQEGKVTKATKDSDVKFKSQEYTALDKAVADLTSDYSTSTEELAAVNEYFAKVKDRCVAKPTSYSDRKKKREDQIKGLEEAKALLEASRSSFLQRRHHR